ncbi:hypothetical protein L3476_22645 [Paenibacillus thiaminolyticus]|uniref:hypothetical protein n=1 Tax=Paenibacillus thiaminolyticus TaxID=49283 RepID=UPI00234FE297|nr:hypothetical protein [Paenibacillus thiaminolyticus]WCR26055.1 hypothetical protein L3476_22645 [Paenibacillus thiaminolyticus]
MNLKEIMQLPDVMPKEQLEEYFTKYLDSIEGIDKLNNLEILESFSELADRQVYTYELLNDTLRNRVDIFVQKLWDTTSVELVDVYSYVVINLSFKKSYELMKSSLNLELEEKVRKIIEETIDEVGEDIEVPFKMN